jgi:hypothetical protein
MERRTRPNTNTQALLATIEETGVWRETTKHLYVALSLQETHVMLIALACGRAKNGWDTLPEDHEERMAYESLVRKLGGNVLWSHPSP